MVVLQLAERNEDDDGLAGTIKIELTRSGDAEVVQLSLQFGRGTLRKTQPDTTTRSKQRIRKFQPQPHLEVVQFLGNGSLQSLDCFVILGLRHDEIYEYLALEPLCE